MVAFKGSKAGLSIRGQIRRLDLNIEALFCRGVSAMRVVSLS